MSVNNNPNIPAENLFFNPDGLKNANLTENEKTVLSNCDYKDFAEKWYKSLGNISAQAHTHINRNVKEIKEGIFRQLGAAMGFCSFDPWKETQQVFSDWKSFDGYVRMKISSETYQKIAKANPQYFDKVIEHLEHIADDLDKRADVRLKTFVSNQSGETLAMLASNFRSTAAFLRLKMKGGENIEPRNNNERPVANPGDRPTVINHYHNNINIGQIGNNYIGHAGDNNFYNKGNMAVMFKKSSNGVPHAGFKSEHPIPKLRNSYYSPTINGKKLLELTSEQALELFKHNSDKKKSFEMQRSGELTFEAQKPLPKEKPKNFERQQVNSINIKPKENENAAVSGEKKDLSNVGIQTEDNEQPETEPNNTEKSNKVADAPSVQSEANSLKQISSDLQNLRDEYYRLWDKIHQDKDPKTATANTDNSVKNRTAVFENNNRIEDSDDSFTKLTKLFRQIVKLNETLKTLEQSQKIDRHQLSSISPMLNQIARMIGNDKKTVVAKEIPQETGKSDLAGERHGLSWEKEVKNKTLSEEEERMDPDASRNRLIEKTQKVIDNINKQLRLETLKKITNPSPQDTNKTKSQPKPRPDVKEINQETNQPSAFKLRQQFGMKIGEKNKNLKKRADKQEKLHEPSARERREAYQNDTVDVVNTNMKKDPFDRNAHKWIPNDGSNMQKTADNENHKTFNTNVTDPLFHRHDSQ